MTSPLKPILLALATLGVACGDDADASTETTDIGSTSTSAAMDATGSGPTATTTTGSTTAPTATSASESSGSTDDGSSSSGDGSERTNTDKALALIDAFETGDPAALDDVSERYIQHNLAFPDGKEVLAGLLAGEPTGFETRTVRVFEDGNIVFMHNEFGGTWNGGTPQVTFDVFRFDDEGLIAEHWDNLADVVDDGDGTTQLDGPTVASSLGDTEANRATIDEALQTLFVDGQWSQTATYFDLKNYVQHSVGFGADATGLQELLGGLPDGTAFYSSVEYIYVMGDMALTLSEGVPNAETGLSDAYYDLFRMDGGLIVEHWDIVQPIPPEDEWANTNGKW